MSRAIERTLSLVPGVVVVKPDVPNVASKTPLLVYRAIANLFTPLITAVPAAIILPWLSNAIELIVPLVPGVVVVKPDVPNVVSKTPLLV